MARRTRSSPIPSVDCWCSRSRPASRRETARAAGTSGRSPSGSRPSDRPSRASTSCAPSSSTCPTGLRTWIPWSAMRWSFPTSTSPACPAGMYSWASTRRSTWCSMPPRWRPALASRPGSTTSSSTGPATERGSDDRSASRAWPSSTSCCGPRFRCIVSSAVASRTIARSWTLSVGSSRSSSTAGVRCGRWRSSARPAVASRCWQRRRPAGSPPKATGRCWSASTSGWQRPCCATWPMPRRRPDWM